jgi:hypothetical protein
MRDGTTGILRTGSSLTVAELSSRLALTHNDPRAIIVQPAPDELSGGFIQLHLHDSFMELTRYGPHRLVQAAQYSIQPERLILGTTQEVVTLPADLHGKVLGKTDFGRLGLVVHANPIVDAGLAGRIVFEIHNFAQAPIAIAEGMPVLQLTLFDGANIRQRSRDIQSLVLDLSRDSVSKANIFTPSDHGPPVALDTADNPLLFYPRSVSPAEVEHVEALRELERMLADPKLSEKELQSLFCNFPYLLAGPDYTEIRSQVVLGLNDGGSLIPDFFLQPVDQRQLWDIADIKLPKFRTVVHQRHRTRLSGAVMEGIAQLRTYSRYFDDVENRNRIKKLHGIAAYRPRLILVIGRAELDMAPEEWRAIEAEAAGVRLLNYDQVVELARHRIFDPLGLKSRKKLR